MVAGALVAAAAPMAVVAAQPAAAADWSTPQFVRSIGGRGEAGVYAWGNEYNPVTNEILVGDYWNFLVRRYDANTGVLKGSFYRPTNVRKGQPYTISVDPRNGDIYVPEWGDGDQFSGAVGRYDKTGKYLGELDIAAAYNVWTTIDRNGVLWVADSHFWNTSSFPAQVRGFPLDDLVDTHGTTPGSGPDGVYDFDGQYYDDAQTIPKFGYLPGRMFSPATPIDGVNYQFGIQGSDPGNVSSDFHGIVTDSTGHIYIADAIRRRVVKFNPDGTWSGVEMGRDGGPGGLGVGAFTGDLRGIAINEQANELYVVDANASQVEVFNPQTGDPIRNFGTQGDGPGQFADGAREIAVGPDGNLWITDFGHFRFFKMSPTGQLLATFPNPSQAPAAGFFAQNRDSAVDAQGRIWTVDTWNQRFSRHSATGVFEQQWGQRGSSAPYGMNYPRGVAVDPVNGDVWVAVTREGVIRVYGQDGTYKRTIGTVPENADLGTLGWVMDIEFYGGKAYLTSYFGSYLYVYDVASGTEVQRISRSGNIGVAVNPANGDIYIARYNSSTSNGVYVYTNSGAVKNLPAGPLVSGNRFGSTGTGDGKFQSPWDIDIVNGYVYVSDSRAGNIQVFTLDGGFVGKFGGPGTGAYQWNNPSGLTHDANGLLYVSDAGNDRLMVYDTTKTVTTGDTTKPVNAITAPTANQVIPATGPFPVMITGTASDNVAVAKVEVAIQDRVTKQWWSAKSATWQAPNCTAPNVQPCGKAWNIAALTGNPASPTWASAFVGMVHGGQYYVQVRSYDSSGNVVATMPTRNFKVS